MLNDSIVDRNSNDLDLVTNSQPMSRWSKTVLSDSIALGPFFITPQNWLANEINPRSNFQSDLLQSIVWIRCVNLDRLLQIDRQILR